jgi:hypothetical protein
MTTASIVEAFGLRFSIASRDLERQVEPLRTRPANRARGIIGVLPATRDGEGS